MHFLGKITSIIYVLVFISANEFYCIDVANETVTVSVSVDANERTTHRNGTEGNVTDQTTNFESTTQPQDTDSAMQMCNQSFSTPKGTVCQCKR